MNVLNFSSVKTKYLLLSTILALVIIATIIVSESKIKSTAVKLSTDIKQRIEVSEILEDLQLEISKANSTLDLYLISPNTQSRKKFDLTFINIYKNIKQLNTNQWLKKNLIPKTIIDFDNNVHELNVDATELMNIRINPNEMYPFFKIVNQSMLPANNKISALLNNAIIEQENDSTITTAQYHTLVKLRDQWRRLTNEFRLLLVNRLGSLFEDRLPIQNRNIEQLYLTVKNLISELVILQSNNPVGLETEILINNISELSTSWHSDFRKVYRLNNSTIWRKDILILKNKISPQFKLINYTLEFISHKLHQRSSADLIIQEESMDTISYYLWLFASFVIVFIIITTLFLYRNLLLPIEDLSKNLILEAQGKTTRTITNIKTTEIENFVTAFTEMQSQVHSRQKELEHIAMHDALTSLPNRALLFDRLNHLILFSKRNKHSFSLLLLDLDRFKEINDTLGHATGDVLLCSVAERITNCLRDSDTVARLGGDEFAIILSNTSITAIDTIINKIVTTLEAVYQIKEHNLYIGMSIGIANYPEHGEDSSTLIQHADIAMYHSKRTNSNISTYDASKNLHNIKKLSLLADLKMALTNSEMLFHYQAITSVSTMKIVGFECLIRWQHPLYGLITPDQFIAIAEQTGIIKKVSHWVITQGIKQCKKWQNMGTDIFVSINLSVWDLQDIKLESFIKKTLAANDLTANKIIIEITENAMMADVDRAKQVLEKLNLMGLSIAVDDYGTGFSSLSYLKQLPIDTLKIDRSFVTNMDSNRDDKIIVQSTIELAHNLGLNVIAEGVETEKVRDLLIELKCDKIQGYLISKPVSVEHATKLLRPLLKNGNVSYLKIKK